MKKIILITDDSMNCGANIIGRLFNINEYNNINIDYIKRKDIPFLWSFQNIKNLENPTFRNELSLDIKSYIKLLKFKSDIPTVNILNYLIIKSDISIVKYIGPFKGNDIFNFDKILSQLIENVEINHILIKRNPCIAIFCEYFSNIFNDDGDDIETFIENSFLNKKRLSSIKKPKNLEINYENMMMDPLKTRKDICEYCNLPYFGNNNKKYYYNSLINKYEYQILKSFDKEYLQTIFEEINNFYYKIYNKKHIVSFDDLFKEDYAVTENFFI